MRINFATQKHLLIIKKRFWGRKTKSKYLEENGEWMI